jgi:hypothetical protein
VRLEAPREGYDNTLGERFLKLGFGFNEIVCLEHGLVDGWLRLVRPIVLCFRNGPNGPGCGWANGLVGGHGLAGSEDHAEDSSGTFDASRGLLVAQRIRKGGPAGAFTGESMQAGNRTVFVSEGAGSAVIQWAEGDLIVSITSANVPKEDLLRVAESLQPLP